MTTPRSLVRTRTAAGMLAGTLAALIALPALAQPAAAPPPAAGTPAPAVAPPAPAAPNSLAIALAPVPGGLTDEEVGARAAATSESVRAKQAELEAAQARVDQAFVNFVPRLTLAATYTRLSETTSDIGGGASLVGAQNAGAIIACPDPALAGVICDSKGSPIGATPLSFASPLNNYSLTAQLVVPLSDYVLRISQGYASASHGEKAARLQAEATSLQTAADAKATYYNWVRAKGQVVVATEAVAQTRAHLQDAKQTFAVGLISRADVLGLEAQAAAADLQQVQAQAFQDVAEEQLRALLHLPAGQPLTLGTDVMHPPGAPEEGSLDALTKEAFQKRLEIRAIDESVDALHEVESVNQASYLPRLDAFADATYANPNPRIFPAQEEFKGTWDAGLRLSWTLNDTLNAGGTTAEARARTASLTAQRAALRDGLRVEVASAYADVKKAPATIEAADRGVAAAEEALRVRRELFRNGKATGVELVDAEGALTGARFRQIDAHIGLLAARARLAHVTGRDAEGKGR